MIPRKDKGKPMKILITGGTVFVSRYIAEYYVAKGDEVYVLNRNSRYQSAGVSLIQADRHDIGERLRNLYFDVVIDTAYTAEDVSDLLDALGGYEQYILISSSAVYPEYKPQPFKEETRLGFNRFWGKYGTDKIEAEEVLMRRNPDGYILRPPYLYGQMNNVYREAFVFECALAGRKFYLPRDGEMKLQFFHITDLCRFIDLLLQKKPSHRIYNVGNRDAVSVREWVELGYRAAGKQAEFVNVYKDVNQRNYFSFYDYEYCLDVSRQCELMSDSDTKRLLAGLQEAFAWYRENPGEVNRKPFWEYIERHIEGS